MNKFERKTYGQILQERQFAEQIRLADSYDFSKLMMQGMLDDVNAEIAEHSKGKFKDKTFYVMALIAIESVGKAPIIKVCSLAACPYPSLNQTIWKIDHDKQEGFLLWTLPGKKDANAILNNPQQYLNNGGSKETMEWVYKLRDKVLRNISDRENGFKKDIALILQENAC